MMKRIATVTVMSIALGACASGLKLTEKGEKVRVLDPGEVASCRELGKTNTSVTPVILGIPRAEEVVSKELRVIARNSASRMGGDTVVPLTVIEDGEQSFLVYKCVDPNG